MCNELQMMIDEYYRRHTVNLVKFHTGSNNVALCLRQDDPSLTVASMLTL
jgi:hypothetical protein